MMEEWKEVPGFDYRYEVSDQGRVRTFSRWGEGRLMRSYMLSSGKLAVKLIKDGKRVCKQVHRLVMECFVGPCPDGQYVCHGPGGGLDNRLSNLRYDTQSANCFDKHRDGTMYNARKVKRSDGTVFDSIGIAARESQCCHSNIVSVLKGKRNKAGGYTWEYVDA